MKCCAQLKLKSTTVRLNNAAVVKGLMIAVKLHDWNPLFTLLKTCTDINENVLTVYLSCSERQLQVNVKQQDPNTEMNQKEGLEHYCINSYNRHLS